MKIKICYLILGLFLEVYNVNCVLLGSTECILLQVVQVYIWENMFLPVPTRAPEEAGQIHHV